MLSEEKEVQFYSAAVNAWFATRLEHDRSILMLSAGGIGLLITLMSTIGIHSIAAAVLYIAALISFLGCLAFVLWIFRQNAEHLQEILSEDAAQDNLLRMLDTAAKGCFFLGAVLSSIIGISAAIQSTHLHGMTMSTEQKNQGKALANDSFSKAASLRPMQGGFGKSYEGASKLRPATPSGTRLQKPTSSSPAVPIQRGGGKSSIPTAAGRIPQAKDGRVEVSFSAAA